MDVDAVVFDLYETLITEGRPGATMLPAPPFRAVSWKVSVAERLGVDDEAFREAWRPLNAGRMRSRQPTFPDLLRTLCADLGVPADDDLLAEVLRERLADKAVCFERPDPAVASMLSRLRAAAVKVGVVSNCNTEEVAAFPSSWLADAVDAVVFSCDEGCAKPDPEIYALACRRLDVNPARVLFVGDGGSDELRGAARAGMAPLWATWFIERWPTWDESGARERNPGGFPRMRLPGDLLATVGY